MHHVESKSRPKKYNHRNLNNTYAFESLTSSTRRSNGCGLGVALDVVEEVWSSDQLGIDTSYGAATLPFCEKFPRLHRGLGEIPYCKEKGGRKMKLNKGVKLSAQVFA